MIQHHQVRQQTHYQIHQVRKPQLQVDILSNQQPHMQVVHHQILLQQILQTLILETLGLFLVQVHPLFQLCHKIYVE